MKVFDFADCLAIEKVAKNKDKNISICYYLEYLDYWPHIYCYNRNVSTNMSFGLPVKNRGR